MRRITVGTIAMVVLLAGVVWAPAALADHTNPRAELSSTQDPGGTELLTAGEGTWEFIRNFPPNPGTDVKFFKHHKALYAAAGTLGQADEQNVGQRIIQLLDAKGELAIEWVADHGSANCPTANPSGTTGLQHDQTVTPAKNPKLLIDTTDATGRCHDPAGGGLEIVDISKIHDPEFEPREIHLTRHVGTSHTVTRDAKRPWIIYNNASQSSGNTPWIDVLDIRSCLKKKAKTLAAKRKACKPKVYRIVMLPEWTRRIDVNGDQVDATEASCHDITAVGYRLYCANLNSTVILDVKNLTDKKGNVRGKPIKCERIDGTLTEAKVTDCSNLEATGGNQARGWKYIGHVNHAGRNGSHNTNTEYESTENIAVSHEAEPTYDKKWMFVTDERGGGIVPGGASCPGGPNPYGNGGVHVFDISKKGEFEYAQAADGSKAVFIGAVQVPAPSFCTAHVMEQFKGEQRFSIAWYSQGTKIVDWFVDNNGKWSFREIASVAPSGPPAQTWTSIVFKTVTNDDGTKTYYFISSDITRGIDIFSWTGPPNPKGTPPPSVPAPPSSGERDALSSGAVAFFSVGVLAAARRRRRVR